VLRTALPGDSPGPGLAEETAITNRTRPSILNRHAGKASSRCEHTVRVARHSGLSAALKYVALELPHATNVWTIFYSIEASR
jgi:hypothetical protein